MAKSKASTKTVRLTHPNGVTVSVDALKEERLRDQGFTDAKSTTKTSSSK